MGLLACAAPAVLHAADAPDPRAKAAVLKAEDRADLERIRKYLNDLTTMDARFVQIASNGDYAEGSIFLDRPGRLRIDYDPPSPIQIIANRGSLIYFDSKLKQVSYVGLDQTPAGILLRETIDLEKETVVTAFSRGAGTLSATMVRRDDPGVGSLTLIFSDQPLTLRKWIVNDAQGIETSVTLIDARFGVSHKADLFEFKDPNFFSGGPDQNR